MSEATRPLQRAQVGDVAMITGHRVGEAPRTGEVLEVLGDPGHEHYRVRWDDGRESIFYPGNDVTFRRSTGRRAKRGPA